MVWVLSLVWFGHIVWYKIDNTKMKIIIIEHRVRLFYSMWCITNGPTIKFECFQLCYNHICLHYLGIVDILNIAVV
jgi:hypothetical protein